MASTTGSDGLVKLTVFLKKRDDISHEEFHKYWDNEHAKIFLSVPIVKKNVVKYTQFHANNGATADITNFGLAMVGYDGVANIWGKSLDDLLAIYNDEEFLRVSAPDGDKFFVQKEIAVMYGWEEDKWDKQKDS
ncbi:uncharacterized protein GGS25DRAFT_521032 [Hypoxylon fragiforme]|uniref:uncharacterized protein n=1 Tax=Hypoxylon fragiforme TaxID=63214 RepID=UPI0020C7262A|nr:uncharacterized protein GGS25DRAFT_521032 [Hypoxylon fragiforme]KAI2610223.1 hypothetical protein GGS25DRAFT_521032 [Hypoxylon fragiforme]